MLIVPSTDIHASFCNAIHCGCATTEPCGISHLAPSNPRTIHKPHHTKGRHDPRIQLWRQCGNNDFGSYGDIADPRFHGGNQEPGKPGTSRSARSNSEHLSNRRMSCHRDLPVHRQGLHHMMHPEKPCCAPDTSMFDPIVALRSPLSAPPLRHLPAHLRHSLHPHHPLCPSPRAGPQTESPWLWRSSPERQALHPPMKRSHGAARAPNDPCTSQPLTHHRNRHCCRWQESRIGTPRSRQLR